MKNNGADKKNKRLDANDATALPIMIQCLRIAEAKDDFDYDFSVSQQLGFAWGSLGQMRRWVEKRSQGKTSSIDCAGLGGNRLDEAAADSAMSVRMGTRGSEREEDFLKNAPLALSLGGKVVGVLASLSVQNCPKAFLDTMPVAAKVLEADLKLHGLEWVVVAPKIEYDSGVDNKAGCLHAPRLEMVAQAAKAWAEKAEMSKESPMAVEASPRISVPRI